MRGMKQWQETQAVFGELARITADGGSACLALLHAIKGSSFRRPGAKLLIRADGSVLGNISGGCLEEDLRERAARCLAAGAPDCVHYDTSDDETSAWGLGLGCGGEVDIRLIPFGSSHTALAATIRDRMARHEPLALAWPLGPDGDAMPRIDPKADKDAFIENLSPPPRLILVGAGIDTDPLVDLGVACGFRVAVIDHRKSYLDACPAGERLALRPDDDFNNLVPDPDTAVVIKMHALNMDRAWAVRFAASPAGYIGLLGPRHRRDTILAAIPDEARPRFHGPAGLDLGGEGAEQMAVSIVGEILAWLHERPASPLREKTGPIHG